MRSFLAPFILDEPRLCGELNHLNHNLELTSSNQYLLKQRVISLEKRLKQAEDTIKAITLERELDLSRLSAIQFRFEKEISALKEKIG